jgi:hypothetical protein
MPIYFAWFTTALLSVDGDANDQNLPQSGRLLYCVRRGVAVEKVGFPEKNHKSGDRKYLGDSEKSFIELPDAKEFLRNPSERVFSTATGFLNTYSGRKVRRGTTGLNDVSLIHLFEQRRSPRSVSRSCRPRTLVTAVCQIFHFREVCHRWPATVKLPTPSFTQRTLHCQKFRRITKMTSTGTPAANRTAI